jgi:hypothetical protein
MLNAMVIVIKFHGQQNISNFFRSLSIKMNKIIPLFALIVGLVSCSSSVQADDHKWVELITPCDSHGGVAQVVPNDAREAAYGVSFYVCKGGEVFAWQ